VDSLFGAGQACRVAVGFQRDRGQGGGDLSVFDGFMLGASSPARVAELTEQFPYGGVRAVVVSRDE